MRFPYIYIPLFVHLHLFPVQGIKISLPQSWDLQKLGETVEKSGHSISDFTHKVGKGAEAVGKKYEVDAKKNDALDWAKHAVGDSAEFLHHFAQDNEAVSDLVDQALSSARSYCHSVKLAVLSDLLGQLSDDQSDTQSDLQVQHFQTAIDSHLKSHHPLSTREEDWNDFTNQTSLLLYNEWSELQQVLLGISPGQQHLARVDRITKQIASGFASTWDEIQVFLREHPQAHIKNIERMINDHPVLFKAFAMVVITGGSILIAPSAILTLLLLFGFSAIGPIAGSPAAIWQAAHYGAAVPKGSLFSLMQKLAMGGLVASTFVELLIGCSLVAMGGYIIRVLKDGSVEVTSSEGHIVEHRDWAVELD